MLYIAEKMLRKHHLAEEAVLESLEVLAKNLNLIDEVKSYRTINLIMIITKHFSRNIREKERVSGNNDEYDDIEPEYKLNLDYKQIEDEEVSKLVKTISELPVIYCEVLALNIGYGLKPKDIERILSINNRVIKKRIQKGKKILYEALRGDGK